MKFIDEKKTFELNENAKLEIIYINDSPYHYIQITDFYKNPKLVNELAHAIPLSNDPDMAGGLPTGPDSGRINATYDLTHFSEYFGDIISKHFQDTLTTRPGKEESLRDCLNRTTFMINVMTGNNLPVRCPHVDTFEDGFYAASIGLTPPNECKGGTAFYNFTGEFPSPEAAVEGITEYMSDSAGNWKMIHLAELAWNKCIIYPSNWWHHAYVKPGWFTNGSYRLTQQMFI